MLWHLVLFYVVIINLTFRLNELENATQGRRPAWMRLLKKAAPLQLVLVMALGLGYLIDPSNSDSLINLGLVFSPQLRYVRGPPPL